MKLTPQIAVDFGSTKIRAAAGRGGEVFSCPAVVAQNIETKDIVAVGESAQTRDLQPVEELVHPLAAGKLVSFKPGLALVQHAFQAVLPWWQVIRPQVLFAKSARVSSAQETVWADLFRVAGAGQIFAANTATLAGFGAGIEPSSTRGQLVVHIGAQTTEAAILSRGSAVKKEVAVLGGQDFAAAVSDYVADRYNALLEPDQAAAVVTTVGAAVAPDHEQATEVFVVDAHSQERKEIVLTSSEVAEAVAPVLKEITDVLGRLLKDSPTALLSDIADQEVYLTGGAAQLAHIDTFFSRRLTLTITVAETPELAVVGGGRSALSFIDLYKQSMPQ